MSRLLVLQHLCREGPGLFATVALERAMTIRIVRLDQGESFPKLEPGDLLLVLGGSMGIRDKNDPKYFWMLHELDFIKEALSKRIAIVGVCLGAQLLAHVEGGKVESLLDRSSLKLKPEVGWGAIYASGRSIQDSENILFKSPFNVLHWHGDRIILPPSAELLASSKRCKEQLFKIGANAYGLQFHVEIEDQMFEQWIKEDPDFIRAGLGLDAELTLRKQQKEYGQQTLNTRFAFIRKLFQSLCS
ncbi:type 1 glutamine amidotransferase [Prochlorococcus sp. MIT 1300]|uniref:type 1 glutamine amidotransferase n=1 Tax=Prochlorococcus sp. MIT 1300 TaxID=3096218 RepID=UPI002A763353|nr:type 1 glutamine amidotransferase [Prochlorococcus sp. MIT 1300]